MPDVEDYIARHVATEGNLLPILNDVQAHFGHVSDEAIRTISDALNLTRAEVHGVVSFYHDYRTRAPALPVIKLCRAEACQARGCETLIDDAEASAAGRVTIESVYCLGLCAVGPAALADGNVYARLNRSKLAALIEAAA